ncbi:MAG: hypothetical protein IPK19_21435 [Chloroflexi bacterium]|nr:hypothetical protein [Chloroflexota bacterium]
MYEKNHTLLDRTKALGIAFRCHPPNQTNNRKREPKSSRFQFWEACTTTIVEAAEVSFLPQMRQVAPTTIHCRDILGGILPDYYRDAA